jgi:aspartate carbamoyltransferase regulatory subunit
MLEITGINKGIVIDHIKAGLGYKIFKELKLHEVAYPTALIRSVSSNKLGIKDLIKIDNVIDLDLNILGLIDPNLTITIIENGRVTEKKRIELPTTVVGILTCKNPRCITTIEHHEPTTFHLVNSSTKEYRCEFCNTRSKL